MEKKIINIEEKLNKRYSNKFYRLERKDSYVTFKVISVEVLSKKRAEITYSYTYRKIIKVYKTYDQLINELQKYFNLEIVRWKGMEAI